MCAFSSIPVLAFKQEDQVLATVKSNIVIVEESAARAVVAAIVAPSTFMHLRKTNPMAE